MKKVFGEALQKLPTINHLPFPVYQMLEELNKNWNCIIIEGIFRIPGDVNKTKILEESYNNGEAVDLSSVNIHTVAGLLKLFIRKIPNSLMCNDTKDMCFATSVIGSEHEDVSVENLKTIISFIPIQHYYVLKHVLYHLKLIDQYSDKNKMDRSNLSKVFAPVLFQLDIPELMDSNNFAIQTVSSMILHYDELFSSNVVCDGSYSEPSSYQHPKGDYQPEINNDICSEKSSECGENDNNENTQKIEVDQSENDTKPIEMKNEEIVIE
ncbi:Rho-GAP domain-containing protein [Entamoeba marina]